MFLISEKIFILDASGIINGFYSKSHPNIMTSKTVAEIKDMQTQIRLEDCIAKGFITIEDITKADYESIEDSLVASGDFLRLSDTDKEIVAISLKYKNMGYDTTTVTDDYSMQNALKLLGLRFKSVNTQGIKKTIKWKRVCKGCRKQYPADSKDEVCEICGSPIIQKRVGGRSNY